MFTVYQSVTVPQLVIQYCPWPQTSPSEIYAVMLEHTSSKSKAQNSVDAFDFSDLEMISSLIEITSRHLFFFFFLQFPLSHTRETP